MNVLIDFAYFISDAQKEEWEKAKVWHFEREGVGKTSVVGQGPTYVQYWYEANVVIY